MTAASLIHLGGDTYRSCCKPYKSIAGCNMRQMFEGIYTLDSGNILEAHEWMNPDWGDCNGNDPFGAVYYDIFELSAIGEEDPIPLDGGVMGYEEDNTLSEFNDWLRWCGQGSILNKIGEPEVSSFTESVII